MNDDVEKGATGLLSLPTNSAVAVRIVAKRASELILI
jgi:hypothetical protein